MTKSESVVIPFPTPRNPLHSHVADECPLQAAAEYRAALLTKLLRRMPEPEGRKRGQIYLLGNSPLLAG
ncbi:hypothetical protein SAMN03159511_0642 [Pseudomonas sp. NFACC19-2]|nr:hypothetical protein [Pseudomonas sp. NFACC19-2]SFW12996.1 hypothetical protein SAMN03159511_0642 [Pseudomonas sp. NFACC19-2]